LYYISKHLKFVASVGQSH